MKANENATHDQEHLFVVLHLFYYFKRHDNSWFLYLATEMERPPAPTTVSWHTHALGPKFCGDFYVDLMRNDNDNELSGIPHVYVALFMSLAFYLYKVGKCALRWKALLHRLKGPSSEL